MSFENLSGITVKEDGEEYELSEAQKVMVDRTKQEEISKDKVKNMEITNMGAFVGGEAEEGQVVIEGYTEEEEKVEFFL